MSDLDKLKLLIFETKYPYFTDEQLQEFLEIFDNDVYLTAAQLCLMKKDNAKSITVGPITIQNAEPTYWGNLAIKYMDMASKVDSLEDNTTGYYLGYMKRADE